MSFGQLHPGSTASSVSGAVGVSALSFDEVMVAYRDGGMSVFSAGDTIEEVCYLKLDAPGGIRHFTACAASSTDDGYMGVFAASHVKGVTVGRVDLKRTAGVRGDLEQSGYLSYRVDVRVTPQGTVSLPGGAASCVHIDAPSRRLVYGTGSGLVGVRSLERDEVTAVISLATGALEKSGNASNIPQQGPHCHSVSCWSYAPNIAIATAGSSVHLLDYSGEKGVGQKLSAGDKSTILCTAFHPEDPWPIYAGTDGGSVLAWDMRKTDRPCRTLPGVHVGGVSSLSCAAIGVGSPSRYEISSCGDDGVIKRIPLEWEEEGGEGGRANSYMDPPSVPNANRQVPTLLPSQTNTSLPLSHCTPWIVADAPLTGLARLCSRKQRIAGKGESYLLASSSSGALEYGVTY